MPILRRWGLFALLAGAAVPVLGAALTPVDQTERPSKDLREADFAGFDVTRLSAGASAAERVAARDADWKRLFLLLTHHQFTENEKIRWVESFVTAYQNSPGLDAGVAWRLKWHLPAGPMRASLEKTGKSPWDSVPVPARAAASPEPKGKPGKAGIEWMLIPGGTFLLGTELEDPDERPRHLVTVKTFEMAKTETTNKQYRACMADGACTPPLDKRCSKAFMGDDQPVVCVNLAQAEAFSKWAGGRVPTEAEWQYAARSGGKDQRYPWGNEEATCDRVVMEDGNGHGVHTGCGRETTWPVCSKPAGNTEQGLCDMAGNAWEFVEDRYHDSYDGAPVDGSAWVDQAPYNVLCGGSWRNDPTYLQAATRGNWVPTRQDDYHGFRAMRPVP